MRSAGFQVLDQRSWREFKKTEIDGWKRKKPSWSTRNNRNDIAQLVTVLNKTLIHHSGKWHFFLLGHGESFVQTNYF